jgi:hypothetical protein
MFVPFTLGVFDGCSTTGRVQIASLDLPIEELKRKVAQAVKTGAFGRGVALR